jgi:hypothetical protein
MKSPETGTFCFVILNEVKDLSIGIWPYITDRLFAMCGMIIFVLKESKFGLCAYASSASVPFYYSGLLSILLPFIAVLIA